MPQLGPTLTLAIAMVAGVFAQATARRLQVPGIVLLLGVGVILGPDAAGIIDPAALGEALYAITGFGVAVILFHGGLNQNLRRLRAEKVAIRRLITLGALITAAGAAGAAHAILGWGWRLSTLFGTLVIVTGPTVISPVLRRIHVERSVETVLEAEGLFIDAVGAIVAVAALEFAINPSATSFGSGLVELAARLGVGAAVGAAGAGVIILVLGKLRVVPDGLDNVFALGVVFLTYEVSHSVMVESGIAAALTAGMIVGNSKFHRLARLLDFKEQLTVLLIAVLFVLLAANVRIADVVALGTGGVLTVAAVMLVVRPLNVFACTARTSMGWRERLFLSWFAPRGIVAAAVASLFAHELATAGIAGGEQIMALVFLVIATTVTLQGITAGRFARLLGLQRVEREGSVIVGANPLARAVARTLNQRGQEVVMIDTNEENCHAAEEEGLRVLFGNALRESTLRRARVDRRAGFAGITESSKVNLMAARLVVQEHPGPNVAAALTGNEATGVTLELARRSQVELLFGAPLSVHSWSSKFRTGVAEVQTWRWSPDETATTPNPAELSVHALPLVRTRDGDSRLFDTSCDVDEGDELDLAVDRATSPMVTQALRQAGWKPARGDSPR